MARREDIGGALLEHADVRWEEGPDGRVTVHRRKFGPVGSALLRMVRVPRELKVHLDPLGSHVWRLIDGERTAADVLKELEAAYPDEVRLPERLGRHLSTMASHRLIRVVPTGRAGGARLAA